MLVAATFRSVHLVLINDYGAGRFTQQPGFDSIPTGNLMSHWWQQEGHPAKTDPMQPNSSILHVGPFMGLCTERCFRRQLRLYSTGI